MRWLQTVLILPVTGSANNIILMNNAYLDELEICIFHFLITGCDDLNGLHYEEPLMDLIKIN
jgi:hypothetical protein